MDLIALPIIAIAIPVLIYLEARKEKDLPAQEVEREETWNWPQREVGPVGRERLP